MIKNFITRKNLLMLIDMTLIGGGYLLAYFITLPNELWAKYLITYRNSVLITVVVFSFCFYILGLYNQIWRYADVQEYRLCGIVSGVGGAIFILVGELAGYNIPIRIQLSTPCIIFFLLILSRISYKLFMEKESPLFAYKKSNKQRKKRILIVGAGSAGLLILREIKQNPQFGYEVISFVDDNKNKIGRILNGYKIDGPIDKIPDIVRAENIEEVIIAIPTATGEQRKRMVDFATQEKVRVRILPSMVTSLSDSEDSEGKNILIGKLRNIDVEDLLGRDSVKVEDADIHAYIADKVVMVTGGGGSIGSELCRQIVRYGAKKIIVVDNYENNAYEIEQELIREYGICPQVEIISVQDYDRMRRLFESENENKTPIEVVFHAAAHKHVPLMEHNPEQAIKNNVVGTFNVARLCNHYQVKRMILISTDKAVNPTNVMGASKRSCELVIQSMNKVSEKTIYTAVRFGNVLGSNGSVIPLFKKQIEIGGPVTVTHPEIIRYFMTIPEAVSLVLNAGGLAESGEIFVLDMGQPVKILDLAKNLIKLSGLEVGRDIDIVFTGLRPGEKLYEELLMAEEGLIRTKSEKIFVGKMTDIDEKFLFGAIESFQSKANPSGEFSKQWLKDIVDTYHEA